MPGTIVPTKASQSAERGAGGYFFTSSSMISGRSSGRISSNSTLCMYSPSTWRAKRPYAGVGPASGAPGS